MTVLDDIAARLAAARRAESEANAFMVAAYRADFDLLTDHYRERLDEARRVVVRLEREQAAAVERWVGANCGGCRHGG
jgi:hypothetical protein